MPRRRNKKSILTSIALSPITIPLKMTQGIMTAAAMVGIAGLGVIISCAASSSKGRKRYRSKWFW
jgi:ABC-type proline/glycine betaine transport system permease subunit